MNETDATPRILPSVQGPPSVPQTPARPSNEVGLIVFKDDPQSGHVDVLGGILAGEITHTTRRSPKDGRHLLIDPRNNRKLPVVVYLQTLGAVHAEAQPDAYWHAEGFPGRAEGLQFLRRQYQVAQLPSSMYTIGISLFRRPHAARDDVPRCQACGATLAILNRDVTKNDLRAVACPNACFDPVPLWTNEDPSSEICACGTPKALGKTDLARDNKSWKKHSYTRCLIDCPHTDARCRPDPDPQRRPTRPCNGPCVSRHGAKTTNVFFRCRRCNRTWS